MFSFWIQRIDSDETLKDYADNTGVTTYDSSASLTASFPASSPFVVIGVPRTTWAAAEGVDHDVSKKDYGPLFEPSPSDQF